jgi:AAHS family 4-hydroxybenzoate transporter-like MFS transporter
MYWYTNWLPVVLPKAGFTTADAAHQLSLAQTVSLPAGILLGWLVDRGRGRLGFSVCYAIVVGALLLFGQMPTSQWMLLVLFVGGGIVGAHAAIVPMATRNFPSDTLASAIGVGVAMTRVGAILGSLVGGQLLERGVAGAAFFAALALPILGCLILVQVRVPCSNE